MAVGDGEMESDTLALHMMHPQRSKDAFVTLIEDLMGLLVSDGYSATTPGAHAVKPACTPDPHGA